LAPDQKDSDSLPDYPVLDQILERYVEQDQHLNTIVAAGFDQTTVERVISLVDRNEYKRRQAPPGVKITRRAYGRDRRYPLTWRKSKGL
jgi:NAD+ synthase (glutamine-hydrolysing)